MSTLTINTHSRSYWLRGQVRGRAPGLTWRCIGCLLLACLCWPCAAAEGFRITAAEVKMVDGVYRVDAQTDFSLSDTALEALRNGVPLVLELNLQVLEQRAYLWDATVAELVQRYQLSYRALSRQYQVENLNQDDIEVFPSLKSALKYLQTLRDFPLLDQSLIDPAGQYRLALKASLDIESLPTPLRAMAYVTPDWYLGSPWFYLELPRQP